jgi:hypothetical protein
MIPENWRAVARGDGETVGYVEALHDGLAARDLLGHELGRADTDEQAEALVVERGLASLGRSWDWTDGTGVRRRVYVVHVRRDKATVSTGMAGVVGAPGARFELELPVEPGSFRPA